MTWTDAGVPGICVVTCMSSRGELQDRLDDAGAVATPPEVIGAFKRVPDRAGDLLRKMLARFKANRSIAAPMGMPSSEIGDASSPTPLSSVSS